MDVLNKLDKYFKLNPILTGDPDMYLRAKLLLMTLRNGVVPWGKSPSKYMCEAAKNFEKHVKNNFPGKYNFPACAENPFGMGYEAVMC